MARQGIQISAYVAEDVREQMERYVRAHGVTKAHLLESALLHHLQALRELPADVVIPPRITVTARSLEQIASLMENPAPPTEEMLALFEEQRDE